MNSSRLNDRYVWDGNGTGGPDCVLAGVRLKQPRQINDLVPASQDFLWGPVLNVIEPCRRVHFAGYRDRSRI